MLGGGGGTGLTLPEKRGSKAIRQIIRQHTPWEPPAGLLYLPVTSGPSVAMLLLTPGGGEPYVSLPKLTSQKKFELFIYH